MVIASAPTAKQDRIQCIQTLFSASIMTLARSRFGVVYTAEDPQKADLIAAVPRTDISGTSWHMLYR
jgi:hypothetical protein